MGEAKRRQKLDPDFNASKLPVEVKVEKNPRGNKWLCVAYILGVRTVISPHFKHEDAVSASEQVENNFNRFSVSQWRNYAIGGSRDTLTRAITTLDYSDDDEVLGVGTINDFGNLVVDSSLEVRRSATMMANQIAEKAGRPKLFTGLTT